MTIPCSIVEALAWNVKYLAHRAVSDVVLAAGQWDSLYIGGEDLVTVTVRRTTLRDLQLIALALNQTPCPVNQKASLLGHVSKISNGEGEQIVPRQFAKMML